MFADLSLFGATVPKMLVLAIAAVLVNMVVKRALALAGIYRIVWHPALFDVALYVIVLSGLARASQWTFS